MPDLASAKDLPGPKGEMRRERGQIPDRRGRQSKKPMLGEAVACVRLLQKVRLHSR